MMLVYDSIRVEYILVIQLYFQKTAGTFADCPLNSCKLGICTQDEIAAPAQTTIVDASPILKPFVTNYPGRVDIKTARNWWPPIAIHRCNTPTVSSETPQA